MFVLHSEFFFPKYFLIYRKAYKQLLYLNQFLSNNKIESLFDWTLFCPVFIPLTKKYEELGAEVWKFYIMHDEIASLFKIFWLIIITELEFELFFLRNFQLNVTVCWQLYRKFSMNNKIPPSKVRNLQKMYNIQNRQILGKY